MKTQDTGLTITENHNTLITCQLGNTEDIVYTNTYSETRTRDEFKPTMLSVTKPSKPCFLYKVINISGVKGATRCALFTFSYFKDFVNSVKQEPRQQLRQRVIAVKDLIKQLPKPNQDTMQILFRQLKRVIENGEKNRMTYQSVVIVFGPTLMKPEETGNIAVHTVYQSQIMELILLELSSIFGR
ncbi:rho GTPase-activating protein 12-like [Erinaceus europaeus]|uniref:Rho GTPase-activating protein 12-like n=1 Tax=Erinaceus europaeus TaxID=9365 RepID=A0A1S2ZJ31_ERIEU|nr:rho GTPase-activating protein 12-like [Erinaceus europaeus]